MATVSARRRRSCRRTLGRGSQTASPGLAGRWPTTRTPTRSSCAPPAPASVAASRTAHRARPAGGAAARRRAPVVRAASVAGEYDLAQRRAVLAVSLKRVDVGPARPGNRFQPGRLRCCGGALSRTAQTACRPLGRNNVFCCGVAKPAIAAMSFAVSPLRNIVEPIAAGRAGFSTAMSSLRGS